jgi:hypothetical protein
MENVSFWYMLMILICCEKTLLCFTLISPSLFCLLPHSRCRGFVISFDHTQTHTTIGRTPLEEGSARRRDLYLTTQTLYKTNIHAPRGIRTHDPSKRSAADLRLRPRGHWDRLARKHESIKKHSRFISR